jgi:hypothetical protein
MVKIWSKPLDFQIFVGACAPPNFYVAPPLIKGILTFLQSSPGFISIGFIWLEKGNESKFSS